MERQPVRALARILVAVAVALIFSAGTLGRVLAQEGPSPTQRTVPCIGMPPLDALRLDMALSVDSPSVRVIEEPYATTDGWQGVAQRALMTWEAPAEAPACYWVGVRVPGQDEFDAYAIALLEPDAREITYEAKGPPGEYCLRILPLAKERKGPNTDVCFTIAAPQVTGFRAPGLEAPGSSSGVHVSYTWLAAAIGLVAGASGTWVLASRRSN